MRGGYNVRVSGTGPLMFKINCGYFPVSAGWGVAMQPSKTKQISAGSKPFDYPRNLRDFSEKLEVGVRLLMEQIVKCSPVDEYGHKMTNNLRFKEVEKILSLKS